VTDSPEKPNALAVASSNGAEASAPVPAPATDHDDVALIHGRTEDGKGLKILRRRQDRLEIGAIMPLVPGKPITGEVVRLEQRSESPLLCNVHVEYAPSSEARPTSAGPAQVATASYRENWEQIFGKKDDAKPTLN
jgi:hypothetical protein